MVLLNPTKEKIKYPRDLPRILLDPKKENMNMRRGKTLKQLADLKSDYPSNYLNDGKINANLNFKPNTTPDARFSEGSGKAVGGVGALIHQNALVLAIRWKKA